MFPSTAPRPTGRPGVLLITPWYGGNAGGVAVATEALAHGLIRSGIPCAVLELASDGWFPRMRRGSAGEHVLSLALRSPATAPTSLRRTTARSRAWIARLFVRALARRLGLRIAHFHFSEPVYDIVQDIVTSVRLQSVATFHGTDLSDSLNDPATLAATERLMAECSVATTVSTALEARLLHRFPRARPKLRTVRNGIPEDFARLPEAPCGARDIDVLFVGNLIHRKGVDILLRALPSVLAVQPTASVVIAGDGIERRALEALASSLGVQSSVSFIGRQPRSMLPALYRRARILVVPSRDEPLGLVILEGQVTGATVVASCVGGIPEVIVDGVTGVLVPPEDPAALASGIVAQLADASRARRIAAAARTSALHDYSSDAMVAGYVGVYESILDGVPLREAR